MTQEDFVVWQVGKVANAYVLGDLANLEDVFELTDGVPLAERFPDDVSFSLSKDFPDNTLPSDNLRNSDRLVVVSEALKNTLEERELHAVEYLPISIVDHKGKTIRDPYFIVHAINHVDCLDVDASAGTWSELDESTLAGVDQLVLDLARIDARRELFRPFPMIDVVVVRRALADELDARGFKGLRWKELADCYV